jgi:hypothetical protein
MKLGVKAKLGFSNVFPGGEANKIAGRRSGPEMYQRPINEAKADTTGEYTSGFVRRPSSLDLRNWNQGTRSRASAAR